MNVLVPGAGGPAAIGAIKSLKMCGFDGKIIATDCNPLSAGFYLADKHYVLPQASAPDFFTVAKEVIEREHIDAILPTSGFDIFPYSRHREELKAAGITAVISDIEVLEICNNKWETYNRLKEHFDLPLTSLDYRDIGLPCVAKPRLGKGSRDIFVCRDVEELEYTSSNRQDLIYQEHLPGAEYTLDVLSDLDGTPLLAVPRLRIETRGGVSVKGRIVLDPKIQKLGMDIADVVGLIGPSCIQVKQDREGILKLVEINARMGGGTIFTTLAGANYPSMILDMVDGKELSLPKLDEITVVRYWEEVVVDKEEKNGRV